MEVYQVVLIDGDGASFSETPISTVYKKRKDAEELRESYIKEGDWWDVEVRMLVVV